MLGGFTCPYCNTVNACPCDSCLPFIKIEDIVLESFGDESLVCGECHKRFNYDQALDAEYKNKTL